MTKCLCGRPTIMSFCLHGTTIKVESDPDSDWSLRNTDEQGEGPRMELRNEAQQATGCNGDLLVTLDARGYAPDDITVKLEGRRLAVVAMKQAEAGASQTTSSSPSSNSSFASASSAQLGFVQRIDLPAHLDLSGLSCSLMDDGQLRIDVPAAKQPIDEERQVPIRFRTSLEFPITKDKTAETHTD